jgi:dihydroorotate dehydrogenase electron transfer subunit
LLLNAIEARRVSSVCVTTTEDGTSGEEGRVTDVLAETMERCETEAVYTCGPHPMLAAVSKICIENRVPVQVAVEELMGCGYGVCMTCVMPLHGAHKKQDEDDVVFARSCTEGPVFNGARVVWDGETVAVSADQAELTPGGTPTRHSVFDDPMAEQAPPGN